MNKELKNGTLILIYGVAGCGKTTVARELAKDRQCEFIDADDLHTDECVEKMSTGIPLDDDDRESWIERVMAEIDAGFAKGKEVILACSALRSAFRKKLKSRADRSFCLFLDVPLPIARHRVASRRGHYFSPSLVPNQFEILEEPEEGFKVDATLPFDTVYRQSLALLESNLE